MWVCCIGPRGTGITEVVSISVRGGVFADLITTTVRERHLRSHYKGATGRVRTGDQRHPVLCHCQLRQDIPIQVAAVLELNDHVNSDSVHPRLAMRFKIHLKRKLRLFKRIVGRGPGGRPNPDKATRMTLTRLVTASAGRDAKGSQ